MKTAETAIPYEFDFEGECDPLNPNRKNTFNPLTFRVRVFQWIPRTRGNGLKKSRGLKTIRGYSSNPEVVHIKAKKECEHYQQAFGFNLHPSL